MTLASQPTTQDRDRRGLLLLVLVQAAVLAMLFGQTWGFGVVFFDDDHYVVDNRFVQQGLTAEGIRWAFTTFYLSNWHPLSWLSHMLDVELFGLHLGAAHLHNVLLHGFNSLLVYWLLKRLTQHPLAAALASTVFLVHPLHAESVAWLAERKDLLCAFFYLAGLVAYDRYRARPGWSGYLLCVVLLVAALMAKPMAVTFPCLLLVLDFFHYRHRPDASSAGTGIQKLMLEKLPLFMLVLVSCIVTFSAQQQGGSVTSVEALSLGERFGNATLSYLTYLRQTLVPLNLAAFYPMPQSTAPSVIGLPLLLLVGWVVASIRWRRSHPLVAAGLCWYLGTLVPVIGLVQVGAQAHADRYMYLPSVGILLAFAAIMPRPGSRYRTLGTTVCILLIGYFSVLCFWQVGYWESRHTLFSRVQQVHGPTWRGHFHLAADYIQRGLFTEAQYHASAALQLDPAGSRSLQLLGDIALYQGQFGQALVFYQEAVSRGDPTGGLMNNLGVALVESGQPEKAREAFEQAYTLNPASIAAQRNLQMNLGASLP